MTTKSKGVFLAARRCCQKVRIQVWHPDVSAETVEQDVLAVLQTHGVTSVSRRRARGGPTTPPAVTFLFKLTGDTTPLGVQLRQAGYEEF